MRIGELATRAGVSVRALRYYEEQGLLSSERSARGQRIYAENAVARVQFIQQLYAAGLASRTVVEILPCIATGSLTGAQLRLLLSERAHIEQQIASLTQARALLQVAIDSAPIAPEETEGTEEPGAAEGTGSADDTGAPEERVDAEARAGELAGAAASA